MISNNSPVKIAVVILNWNGKDFLSKFLPSVTRFSGNAEICVADNASTDESIDFLRNNYPQVRVVRNLSNEGFCKGYNTALKQIEAEYYVLLNSDVEVTPEWLGPMVSLMDRDRTIAVCQPKILAYNNKANFEYAGAAGGFLDCNGYPFCRGRIFETIETDSGQYNDTIDVTWASGACFFIRASVYHELQGLDEDFFAHMEEIDLCWRTLNAGYRIVYCSQSAVYHVGGGTLSKENPVKTFLNFRNGLYLLHKNLPSNKLFFGIFLRLCLDGGAGIELLFQGKFRDTWAVIKAHFAYYRSIHKLNKKRKNNAPNVNVLKPYSIILGYFILRRKLFKNFDESLTSKI